MSHSNPANLPAFIPRWRESGAAERANYALFLTELCDLLDVPRPEPTRPEDAQNAYVFERAVTFRHPDGSTSSGRIDLYRRGCFVLEAKQGASVAKAPTGEDHGDLLLTVATTPGTAKRQKKGTATRGTAAWDTAMLAARGQAESYARALPAAEGRPPFLVVVDVGHSIELYAEFTRSGATYTPFPDPQSHRLTLDDLARPEVRETLRAVWLDPLSLDPTRRSARVTRDIAARLAELAVSLERSGHAPAAVAAFLMRALFTMFAEDVELLPKESFLKLLRSVQDKPADFAPLVEELWGKMQTGGYSIVVREKIARFNGGLFADARALSLDSQQLALLTHAAGADWQEVEPSIFGTLLERALEPRERHKLGAHYTPRAYVERLVVPIVVEPLRAEWAAVQAAAVTLDRQGKEAEAIAEVETFHRRLCETRVLDPACGTGNFLYVTLEHLKRLEGEVINLLADLGQSQSSLELSGFTVDPHQLLGIEVNPRAAAIAELVLWIGYLQWHFRTRGQVAPPEPIIKNFHNVECRDAVLAWERTEPVTDERGEPVTRWDGRTTKKHPVTGEDVPDDSARVQSTRYVGAKKAGWPAAEFIVGNPPFVGNKRMRTILGDGYVQALREAWKEVPETVDLVMFWCRQAADAVVSGKASRFGFITTNSITQTFNRPVLQNALDRGLRIAFAVPDHPWVDSTDGAQVRVAMSLFDRRNEAGTLLSVATETPEKDGATVDTFTEHTGIIYADLSVGVDTGMLEKLAANAGLACPGVQLSGQGFIVAPDQIGHFNAETRRRLLRRYVTGRDVTQEMREQYVLDTFGLSLAELRDGYPDAFQWLHDRVKPEREAKRGATKDSQEYAAHWWLFAKTRSTFRKSLTGLARFVVTSRTARHRTFQFLDAAFLPETKVLIFAFDDAFFLGVLSSRFHVTFANRVGGWLGVGNDSTYNHSDCLEKFAFPEAVEEQKARIRDLSERLDVHRKARQALHPALTMTDIYNVLERLRAGTPLTEKERALYDAGLVGVLRQLHDELDAAVAEAYGWPADLPEDELLARLVALNAARAVEEKTGRVRWLRPEFQNPAVAGAETATQGEIGGLETGATGTAAVVTGRRPWPATLPEQARAVRTALQGIGEPTTAAVVARLFTGVRAAPMGELLETLALLGQARQLPDGRFVGQL